MFSLKLGWEISDTTCFRSWDRFTSYGVENSPKTVYTGFGAIIVRVLLFSSRTNRPKRKTKLFSEGLEGDFNHLIECISTWSFLVMMLCGSNKASAWAMKGPSCDRNTIVFV